MTTYCTRSRGSPARQHASASSAAQRRDGEAGLSSTADPAALDSVLGRLRAVPGVTTASLGYPQAPQQGQKGRGLRLILPVEDARALGAAGADSPTGWVSVDWNWLLGERADPAPAQAPQMDGPSAGSPSAGGPPRPRPLPRAPPSS